MAPPGILVFMHAERIQESGDNYKAGNPSSGASGAYQFTLGTWDYALSLAGLANTPGYGRPAADSPPVIQDLAAKALMTRYYNEFSRSWFNVAEAWYGGPGAVGHPGWGGGPGYPTVGEYANQVIAIYHRLGGVGGGGGVSGVTYDLNKYVPLDPNSKRYLAIEAHAWHLLDVTLTRQAAVISRAATVSASGGVHEHD